MRARKFIIGGLLLLVVFVVFLLLNRHQRPEQTTLYRAAPGGSNIQFPYLAGPRTIDFFTGSGFAAYDADTQTTKSISPQFILPTVSQVRWSKTGVLFKASDYTSVDDLYAALVKKGLATGQEYWWLYDFASQKLSVVLPSRQYNVVDAYWNSSGSNYCYVASNGSFYLSGSPDRAVYKASEGARIKQFNGSLVTLSEDNALRQINVADGSEKTLVDANFQDAYVSPDGLTVAYVLNTHPESTGVVPGDLYMVKPDNTDKPRKVLSGFSGAIGGKGGDLYAGYADSKGINRLWLFPKSGQSVQYSLGASLNRGDIIRDVLPVNRGTIYVVSKSDNLVEVTDQIKTVSTPISYRYKIQTDLYEKGFEIHYDPYKDTYEIDITANPFLANQKAALRYIRAQSVDPNQIKIIWRAYDGVNTTNPAVDAAPVPPGFGTD